MEQPGQAASAEQEITGMETDWSSMEPGLRTNKTDSHAALASSHQPHSEPHYLKGLTIIIQPARCVDYRILQNFRERQKVNYTSSFVFEGLRLKLLLKPAQTLRNHVSAHP